jgi:histidinol phosphate aminotransferase (EC 2.6.1.9)
MGFLRDDIEFASPFTVSQKPYKAKLDQNESPYDLPEELKDLILEEVKRIQWNRYPQPIIYKVVGGNIRPRDRGITQKYRPYVRWGSGYTQRLLGGRGEG